MKKADLLILMLLEVLTLGSVFSAVPRIRRNTLSVGNATAFVSEKANGQGGATVETKKTDVTVNVNASGSNNLGNGVSLKTTSEGCTFFDGVKLYCGNTSMIAEGGGDQTSAQTNSGTSNKKNSFNEALILTMGNIKPSQALAVLKSRFDKKSSLGMTIAKGSGTTSSALLNSNNEADANGGRSEGSAAVVAGDNNQALADASTLHEVAEAGVIDTAEAQISGAADNFGAAGGQAGAIGSIDANAGTSEEEDAVANIIAAVTNPDSGSTIVKADAGAAANEFGIVIKNAGATDGIGTDSSANNTASTLAEASNSEVSGTGELEASVAGEDIASVAEQMLEAVDSVGTAEIFNQAEHELIGTGSLKHALSTAYEKAGKQLSSAVMASKARGSGRMTSSQGKLLSAFNQLGQNIQNTGLIEMASSANGGANGTGEIEEEAGIHANNQDAEGFAESIAKANGDNGASASTFLNGVRTSNGIETGSLAQGLVEASGGVSFVSSKSKILLESDTENSAGNNVDVSVSSDEGQGPIGLAANSQSKTKNQKLP